MLATLGTLCGRAMLRAPAACARFAPPVRAAPSRVTPAATSRALTLGAPAADRRVHASAGDGAAGGEDGADASASSSPASSSPATSAHRGPSIKRTAQRVAPRRTAPGGGTAAPSSSSAPATEFHGRRRVRSHVKPSSGRFPYAHDSFEFDGLATTASELTAAFEPLVSRDRLARLDAVVEDRSFDLMPILEGVYDIGNVLAVCRTTEALGVGCLGVVSDDGLAFKQSGRTSGGAVKWTHVNQWRSTAEAVRDVKARGYRVLVTVFEGGHPLEHYDWTVPTAVILGNEREGVSEEAKELADGGVYVTMNGFTESLNVSVASALTTHHAVRDRRRRSEGRRGDLSDREKETLRAAYLARLVPNYARHGYLRQLLERHRAKTTEGGEEGSSGGLAVAAAEGEEGEEDQETTPMRKNRAESSHSDEEIDDEVALLNALRVAKIVKRPRKLKFGRPVKDDHARIMAEVELAPERGEQRGEGEDAR